MVKHSHGEGQRAIDLPRLKTLGEMVWPGGGGEEIARIVAEVNENGFIDLARLFKNRV